MKNQIFVLIICLSGMLSLHAQEFSVGARGGFNFYSIGDINSRGGSITAGKPDELFSPKKDIGIQFGGYLNVAFGKFFLQPELNYASSKNHYDFPDKKANWNSSRIDFPVLIGYTIFEPVSIYAGPGVNFVGKTSLDGVQVTSFSDGGPNLESTTFNLNVGLMIKWKRFGIDLRYEQGMSETQEELLDIINSAYGVNLADLRVYTPNVISISFMVDIVRTNDDDIGGFISGLFKGGKKCHCPY